MREPRHPLPSGGRAVAELDQRQPGRSRAHLHGAEFRRGVLRRAHLRGAARHLRLLRSISLVVALAFGMPVAWLVERTDFRAKTLLFTLMTIGLLIPGFAAAMGWLFLLHPRIGLAQSLADRPVPALGGPPFNISSIARHGLGAGAQPRAARLHHDGRGVPRDGPDARGGRADARRRRADGAAAHHPAARLARHPRRRDLHLHDRLRRLRRAGDHRLGQSHLHLHDLSLSAAQSAGRAAALWAGGRAQHRRARDRRAAELVVRRHAAAHAPLRRGHRQGLSAADRPARPPRDPRPGASSASISC